MCCRRGRAYYLRLQVMQDQKVWSEWSPSWSRVQQPSTFLTFVLRLVQSTDSTVSWAQWDMLISPWEQRRAVESKQGCCPEGSLSMGSVADLTSKGYLDFSETNICALKKTHLGVFSFGFSTSLMSAIVCDNAGNNLWQSMKIESSWF